MRKVLLAGMIVFDLYIVDLSRFRLTATARAGFALH